MEHLHLQRSARWVHLTVFCGKPTIVFGDGLTGRSGLCSTNSKRGFYPAARLCATGDIGLLA